MVAEIWASVISSFVDQLVALTLHFNDSVVIMSLKYFQYCYLCPIRCIIVDKYKICKRLHSDSHNWYDLDPDSNCHHC